MADTGFKVCGAVVSSAWNTTAVTTTRINTSDNSYAQTVGAFQTATINNFSFGVPAGATIDGIELLAEISVINLPATATLRCSLSWDNGTNYTATKSDTTTVITDANKTYGGATDTWGHAFTDSELANGTFLVKIEGSTSGAGGGLLRLDYLAIKVYYTAGGQKKSMTLLGVG